MKRLFLILLVAICSMTAVAQESHLKFMGIELNGTISEFQTKLLAKGVTVSPDNNLYPVGTRAYKGTFSGEKADIIVWYNERTKQVYRAKAVIKRYGKDMIEQAMTSMSSKLDMKYGSENRKSDVVKDDHLHEFTQYLYLVEDGTIGLFITSNSYSSQSDFYLHVDYGDATNSIANSRQEMDDL